MVRDFLFLFLMSSQPAYGEGTTYTTNHCYCSTEFLLDDCSKILNNGEDNYLIYRRKGQDTMKQEWTRRDYQFYFKYEKNCKKARL